MSAIWLITGLVLLIGGADLLVRGMSAIARVLGVPPLVVGLTLVAFGTRNSLSTQGVGEAAAWLKGKRLGLPAEYFVKGMEPGVEAFRLGVYALARLKSYDALATAVLNAEGQPRVHWWPVAYAFQRIEDKRALPVLLTLSQSSSSAYTRAFAVKGLGALRDESAVPVLLPLIDRAARGAGAGLDPVFYATLGSGVGGGLVAGGKIYHGASPGESELGHLGYHVLGRGLDFDGFVDGGDDIIVRETGGFQLQHVFVREGLRLRHFRWLGCGSRRGLGRRCARGRCCRFGRRRSAARRSRRDPGSARDNASR